MAKNPGFFAYHKDGTQIRFRHAVDFRSALATGKLFQNPPGTPAPEVKEAPKGEQAEGIEPMKMAAQAVQESPQAGDQTQGPAEAAAPAKKKATKIKR